jgi:hypothetical protein
LTFANCFQIGAVRRAKTHFVTIELQQISRAGGRIFRFAPRANVRHIKHQFQPFRTFRTGDDRFNPRTEHPFAQRQKPRIALTDGKLRQFVGRKFGRRRRKQQQTATRRSLPPAAFPNPQLFRSR